MNEKNGQENGADQNISTEGIQHPNGVPATGEVKARRTWPFEAKALMVGADCCGCVPCCVGPFQSGEQAGEEVRANAVPPVVVLDLYGLQQAKLQRFRQTGCRSRRSLGKVRPSLAA
jgi:hypothetical protein